MSTGMYCRCLYWTRLAPELVCESCQRVRDEQNPAIRATGLGTFPISSSTHTRVEDERREQEQLRLYLQRITASALRAGATATAPASDTLPKSRPSHEEIERRRDTVLAEYNSRLPLYRPR